MKTTELREKNEKDLNEVAKKAKVAIEKAVADVIQGKVKNTSSIKKMRKDLARVLTVLKEKQNA